MTTPAAMPVSLDDIHAAQERIGPHVRQTPVLTIAAGDVPVAGMPPSQSIDLKLEFLQHSGSFKVRGAFNNLLSRPVPAAGVVAASGGNHGAAVAFAAQKLGIDASIFVPTIATPAKLDRIREAGARLELVGERYAAALAASEAHVAATGALAVHSFDHPATVAGQGTVAAELIAQAPSIDTVLVAVGGGGLIGGIAATLAGRVKVVSVEPETAPTLHHALAAGAPVDAPAGGIAADSLAPRQIGALPFAIAQAAGVEAVLVPDAAIAAAQEALWRSIRVVSEPGGAAAFAALMSGAYRPAADERVAVVLCGANASAVRFPAFD